jgi:hypothetical protein
VNGCPIGGRADSVKAGIRDEHEVPALEAVAATVPGHAAAAREVAARLSERLSEHGRTT